MTESKLGGDVIGAFALAMFLVLVASLIDDGTIAWLFALPVLALFVFCLATAPLRYSMFTLAFFAFVLENPNEQPAYGQWHSPLYMFGAMMLMHLNNSLGIRWMSFSGMDVMLGTLCLVALYRRSSGSMVDRAGRTPTPKPLIQLAFVSLAGTLYVLLSGLVRGGAFNWAVWQVDRVMYLPVVFLLFQAGLRGPRDHVALLKVLVGAAVLRATMAIFVGTYYQLPADPFTGDTRLPYATTHHDSMLFANAYVVIVAMLLERVGPRAWRLAYLALPYLGYGMYMNNRRLVWVEVAIVFLTTYLVTPINPAKRTVKRVLTVLSPAIVGYLIAGWDSRNPAFKPVQMIRSVVEPATDSSSLWREMENYNLVFTIRQFPIMGTGYGFPFWEVIPLPQISYTLEKYCPHNSILGLWAYAGYFGYTAMTLLWVVGVYFGMRAYHAHKAPALRAAALGSFGAVLVYLVHCFGDLGLGMWTGVFTVAPALAVAGKLAVAAGEWGTARGSSAPDVKVAGSAT